MKIINKLNDFFKIKTSQKDLNYNDYFTKYDRLTFLVLISYVIITTFSIFIYNSIDSKNNQFIWPLFSILVLCVFSCGIYFFTKKNNITIIIFYYLLMILMDSFFFYLSYFSTKIMNDANLYSKYIYFFIFTKIIFAIFKFNFSFLEILIYLSYKSLIFGININIFSKKENINKNISIEIIFFTLTCFCVFLFTLIKQDFITKSMEFYLKNMFSIDYFQSLINSLNKGFLSINLTKYTININKCFLDFLKSIGISDQIIHENLYNTGKKTDKSNLLKLRSFRTPTSTRIDAKNLSSSDRVFLKKSSLFKSIKNEIMINNNLRNGNFIESNLTKKRNLTNKSKFNGSSINPKSINNFGEYIYKDNHDINQINFNNENYDNNNILIQELNIDENIVKNNIIDEPNENEKKIYDFDMIPDSDDEDSFLLKLDFLLKYVFCYFYEESIDRNRNKTENYQKHSLSEAIRGIFYSKPDKNKECISNQNFIFKGIYESREKKILKDNMQTKIILEVHFRRINTTNGEIIEFFFNDITLTRNVETEKAENKVKALVLAKVSHEFKTPLITIIYILKNYIKKNHISKNELSLKFTQNTDEDYISNTIDLSDYMLSLINDIVDYSIINSEFEFKCEFDNFDLHDLLVFSYRILKILINCRGMKDFVHPLLDINGNVPKNFCSDKKRIKQILLNLITNSIKFTRRGYIKISAIKNHENNLMISIEDTGIGIQTKDISKLFKDHSKLYDKESREMNKIGSGLGLSICKKIIEKIGKCIEVESVPNKKTRFYFILENKQEMKKSFSINKSIEKNLSEFKKSIMNVTTNSVKQGNALFKNNRRPKSFNTHVQFNRFNKKDNYQDIYENIPKRLNSVCIKKDNLVKKKVNNVNAINFFEKNNNNLNNNNEDTYIDFVNRNNSVFQNVNNMYPKSINTNENSKSEYLSSGEDTIKNSETKEKMVFSYNILSEHSLDSLESSKFKFVLKQNYNVKNRNTDSNNLQIEINTTNTNNRIVNNDPSSNKNDTKRIDNHKSEIDKSFMKLIKPIKKYYDIKNKDLILVVDDNKFLKKSLKNNIKSIITDTCVDVIGCSDGIEILYLAMLDQMTKNRIKLIISDENMVYMNGTETNLILSSFHTDGKISFIPFALCSATRNDDEYMVRNKISYIINKPASKNELKSVFMTLNLI